MCRLCKGRLGRIVIPLSKPLNERGAKISSCVFSCIISSRKRCFSLFTTWLTYWSCHHLISVSSHSLAPWHCSHRQFTKLGICASKPLSQTPFASPPFGTPLLHLFLGRTLKIQQTSQLLNKFWFRLNQKLPSRHCLLPNPSSQHGITFLVTN